MPPSASNRVSANLAPVQHRDHAGGPGPALATAPAGQGGPGPLLDQRKENRKSGREEVREEAHGSWSLASKGLRKGDLVGAYSRSGGAFDPLGCRSVDVVKADQIRAVVKSVGMRNTRGRWVFITLTIDRTLFLGPELAYQRANEYSRKVFGRMSVDGLWFAALELQTKTGDGWPHWHAIVWVPAGKSIASLKAAADSAWRTTTEHIDQETGELLSVSRESIGFSKVEECRDREAVGTYIAKYVMKPWHAVAGWMLQSSRRFRKVRASSRVYEVLERLHRHVRQRGSRKPASASGRKTRRLLDRMACSGSEVNVFRVGDWGKLEYVRTLPLTVDDVGQMLESGEVRSLRLGRLGSVRVQIPARFLDPRRSWARERERARAWRRRRAVEIWRQWSEYQELRREGAHGLAEAGASVPEVADGGRGDEAGERDGSQERGGGVHGGVLVPGPRGSASPVSGVGAGASLLTAGC
jgi:hypothetical protein